MIRTSEGFRMEKVFEMPTRRSTDSMPAILHSLTNEHGFDRRADVAVSLPHHAFFFADVETDAAGLGRLRAAETAEWRDCFPIPAEEVVSQVCSVLPVDGGKNSVLVAATSHQLLRDELQLLSEARVKPACIDTPVTAARAAVVMSHPESAIGLAIVLYVDESTLSLAVMHDGNLLLVRTIPAFSPGEKDLESVAEQTAEVVAQEIGITWRRLFGNDPDPGLRVFLIASRQMAAQLGPSIQDKIDGLVTPVNPSARIACPEEMDTDFPPCIAQGLALRFLQPQEGASIDFLAAYRTRTRPRLRLTKELTVCAGLAAAAVVVWLAGLFLQLSSLEADYAGLKKQAEGIFRQAAPNEQNIVDPAAQLQQRLDALRKECGQFTSFNPGRPAPLEILYALSRNMPAAGNLRLHDVLIAADSVRITGSCGSFATLSEWQRLLEATPGLRVVDVPATKWDAQSGKVQFTISLSAAEDKA
jgi:Tfp pilus assembly protein PilN